MNIVGSAAMAGGDMFLATKEGDINIIPGREHADSKYTKKKTEVGLWSGLNEGGLSVFAGTRMEKQGMQRTGDFTAGSVITAGNDLVINSGRDINLLGSHLQAGRDAVVTAERDFNMLSANDKATLEQFTEKVNSGISIAVGQNVSNAVRTMIDLPEDLTAGRGGPEFKALTAGSAVLRAVDAVKSATSSPIYASATIGASHSRTEYNSSTNTAAPPSITAGRDISAKAGQDIFIQGGQIHGGRDVTLDAGRDLTITSARNSHEADMTSSSAGGGLGIKLNLNADGLSAGLHGYANASGARSEYGSTSHSNAMVIAEGTLTTISGRDTTVAGAHLEGGKVAMDVGRDLTVASLQDHYDSKNYSWNAGADVTVGYGVNVGVSAGMGKGKHEGDWVGQMTSIVGRKDVDIYVEDNTHIKGAVIATEPGGSLKLDTGTLTFEEIKDKDKGYDVNVGISVSGNFEGGFDKDATIGGIKVTDFSKNGDAPYIPDAVELQYASHDKQGVLRPTITEGEIIVRDDPDADLSCLNRDRDKLRDVTKDENEYVDVYVSPSAIKTIVDGFNYIGDTFAEKKLIEKYSSDEASQKAVKQMLANGVSVEVAEKVASNKEYQSIINELSNHEQAFKEFQQRKESGTLDEYDKKWTNTTFPSTPGQYILYGTLKAHNFVRDLPGENERNAAMLGLQIAMGGPVKAAVAVIKDAIMDTVLGDVKTYIVRNVTTYLAGEMTYNDWLNEPDSDLTQKEKQELVDSVSHITEFGLTVVGVVGGFKFGKKGKGLDNESTFADPRKLDDHYARHGKDFGAKNALEYQAQANTFLNKPKQPDVLEKVRPNGDVVRFNPKTDEFGIISQNGTIRTYYKPDPNTHNKGSNLDYFNAQ